MLKNYINDKKSKYIAELLSHTYASDVSELSAITMYFYQSLVLKKNYPKIAKILEDFSKTEMYHLEILGELITSLGEMPIYADRSFKQEKYWNAYNIYYDKDLKTILEIDIETEIKSVNNYKLIIDSIDEKDIITKLENIIKDEEEHIIALKSIYQKYCS